MRAKNYKLTLLLINSFFLSLLFANLTFTMDERTLEKNLQLAGTQPNKTIIDNAIFSKNNTFKIGELVIYKKDDSNYIYGVAHNGMYQGIPGLYIIIDNNNKKIFLPKGHNDKVGKIPTYILPNIYAKELKEELEPRKEEKPIKPDVEFNWER